MSNRMAGILFLKIDGELYQVKGGFTYNLGVPTREFIPGSEGFKETEQAAFIEGEITDHPELDLKRLVSFDGVTATLELANGKVFLLRNAWYAGDGNVSSEEANITVKFEAANGEEIR